MAFNTLTLAEIQSKLNEREKPMQTLGLTERDARHLQDGADLGRSYYDGDHWQAGVGWVGPRPEVNDTEYAKVLAEIA